MVAQAPQKPLRHPQFCRRRQGFLFCQTSIAEFICRELTQVKHTHISCSIADELSEYQEKPPVEEEHLVSSERLDGMIAQIYHLSRSQSLTLFRDKKVFVNGRLTENNSRTCKVGEVVNVRGFGKFIYDGIGYTTKKVQVGTTTKETTHTIIKNRKSRNRATMYTAQNQ